MKQPMESDMKNTTKDTIVLFYPDPLTSGEGHFRTPYVLLYLERALRNLGLRIVLLDEQIQPDYSVVLEQHRGRLLLAGVSSLTGRQIHGGIAFSRKVRELCDAPVVWGGWHATLLPEQTLQEPYIDYVVVGQGERPLRQLVERLLSGQDTSDIRGLGSKPAGGVRVNPPGPPEDPGLFPNIDFGKLELEKYVYRNAFADRCLGYFASHGCPFNCTFCCIGEIYHHHWFRKPVQQIIADLQYLKEHVGIDSVSFDDDNFFVSAEFVRTLAQAMIEAGLELKWETSAQAGLMSKVFTDEDMNLVFKAGCRQIYIGAESGDQQVLELLHKRTRVADNLHFVDLVTRHGIIPQMSTMVCLPTGSQADVRLTIDMIRRAKLVNRRLRASIFLYTPYPGTELFERAIQNGFVPPDRLEQWANHTLRKFHAPWAPKGLRWQLECFANFYFPLMDRQLYRRVPSRSLRALAYLIHKALHPVAWLRFKLNYFRLPFEAVCFLRVLHLFNRLTGRHYSLGPESYVH